MSVNIYNIDSYLPFSDILAGYLLDITKDEPHNLSKYRLLLPTRRACRVMQDAFLRLSGGGVILLPRMMPLGEVDEDELSLIMLGSNERFLEIPPAITPLKRQLLLAKLIMRVPEFKQGFEGALGLSKALCQFMDQVIIEDAKFSDLYKVVPEEFAAHWQVTLDFLKIISEHWPKILEDNNLIDAAQRRNLLLQNIAEYWENAPPDYPIIAAGSTGSIPAVARLLSVISKMKTGKVILPGLDMEMDNNSWDAITETHPQYCLKSLLNNIGAKRENIRPLVNIDPKLKRHILASLMMLPSESTHQWKYFTEKNDDIESMLSGLEYYSCKTPNEEANVIALIMRIALEEQGKVVALVTPDRSLARRVKGVCKRWGIDVDDSAGEKLIDTKLGKFILLFLNAMKEKFDPVAFIALLKSGFCNLGYSSEEIFAFAKSIEINVLRSKGVISTHSMFCSKIVQSNIEYKIKEYIDNLYKIVQPLLDLSHGESALSTKKLLNTHIKILENIADDNLNYGGERLWRGDVGKAASLFFSDLLEHCHLVDDISYDSYCNIITSLMRDIIVRVPYGQHPRVMILGQMEARLMSADTIILGGVNEGSWPAEIKHDPWMSRPMRQKFGLPASEQMIGFAAHDFVQNFCSNRVIITRSEKSGGTPTIPSRWLERLNTLLMASGKSLNDLSLNPYIFWARRMDYEDLNSYSRPSPSPPVMIRPKAVSVTKVETWLKDPYSIYMYYVLRLKKLDPLRQENDAALKGNMLHKILDKFMHKYPNDLPSDAAEQLLFIAQDVLDQDIQDKEFVNYWWPKLIRIADWFIDHENNWRKSAKFIESEIKGSVDFNIGDIVFTIHGVADRIDRFNDGSYAIIDYKSAGSFTNSKIKKGELPQLPLEAIMLLEGGFNKGSSDNNKKKISSGNVSSIGYWKITGARKAGEVISIDSDIDKVMDIVRKGLENLIISFQNENMPFYCIPNSSNVPRFNDYEHVARIKEWSVLDDDMQEGSEYG